MQITIINDQSDYPMMHAEKIYEIDGFDDNIVSVYGFTWSKTETLST